jgi:hypothetical protein
MLGLIVLAAVMTATIVFAIAAFLIDRGEAALEETNVQKEEK